jgi:transcription termination factor Rho
MDRGFRRKKKRRKGGGMGMPGAPGMHQRPSVMDGSLPSDEELEREAAELDRIVKSTDPKVVAESISIADLQRMDQPDLHRIATREGLVDFQTLSKQDLIFKVLKARAAKQGLMFGEGTLEIMPDHFGFLRSPEQSYLPGPDDIYVSPTTIRRYGLRRGMVIRGVVRPPKESEKYFALLRIDKVNGKDPSRTHNMVNFEDLVPLHPEQRFVLETTPDEIECRIVDLVTPIGKGQRMLIVAPPRTGKTVLMQKMTKAITKNYPDVRIIVLLVDERPEEVTDFKRNCTGANIEVVASTFDENSTRHVQVAEMVIEKARRMVEFGENVIILLDSITRLARAYNAEMPHSGKIMTGGLDSNALQRPKKFFGSARAIDKGGSLTIIGTALVDTGSKMDEVIFEEFKGTGNAELHLDRKLVEKRTWPAIDVAASGTRREELLLDPKELELVYRLRKVLSDMNVVEAMDLLKTRLKKHKTNAEFLMNIAMGS